VAGFIGSNLLETLLKLEQQALLTMHQLRNLIIHEYAEDLNVLTNALQTGYSFVPALINVANKVIAEIELRKMEI